MNFVLTIPKLPLDEWVEWIVAFLRGNVRWLFDGIRNGLNWVLGNSESFLSIGHPLVLLGLLVILAFVIVGWRMGLFTLLGFGYILNAGLWPEMVQTLSLVLTAEIFILLFGLPLGIWAGRNDRVHTMLRPVLDFLQTLPAFVYLIPAVMFFGIGMVPGAVATLIFAIAPLIRLTSLGIRQVPRDLVEASEAFGATELQKLFKVQLPVARTTIMAGVNQSIMLGLSMVIIAAMAGAQGLGREVLAAIQRVDVGNGFVAGLAVVILAIFLDRLTATFGEKKQTKA
ncbi:MAG: proline/glycine betaine ABC transporter permease [Opitutales bacterium]|nr:proline/glycine betaine ABC transporter permease [Opitutales bacterium]MCH8541033.1 proline/glycine betaine ABC transporter permease [Opitutales bacterium]